MKKLVVNDYGLKFRFLLGHRNTGELGCLQDVLEQLNDRSDCTKHQTWLRALGDHLLRVEDYLTLCEAYTVPDGDLNLATLSGRSPTLNISTHSNWAKDDSMGPREDIGIAAASLFGLGCPDDDPSLSYSERQALWARSDHLLWRLWCDRTASEFVDGYRAVVLEDQLWFPERLEQAMRLLPPQPEPKPEPEPTPEPELTTEPAPPSPPRWRLPLIAGVLGAAALITIGAAFRSKDQALLPGAQVWVDCLPNGGKVAVQGTEGHTTQTCPDTGLLPLDGMRPGQVVQVQQGSLPVRFVQADLGRGKPELWQPSPSFAKVLTQRRVVSLALICPTPNAWARLKNLDWGQRHLDCSAPFAQLTLLRPSEAFVNLALAGQGSEAAQTCRVFLPVSTKDHVLLDPTKTCGGLQTLPDWSFPLRGLRPGIDLQQDLKTGLHWLTDPLALGSTLMGQGAIRWNLAEVLQRLEHASGTQGWRIAQAQEVLAAQPGLFARAAGQRAKGDRAEVVALARMSNCPSGLGRVALSTNPARSHAEANAAITLPCQLIGPEVGFWIAKSPQD